MILKASINCLIPVEKVKFMIAYGSMPSKKLIKEAKGNSENNNPKKYGRSNQKYWDVTSRKKLKTLIILDDWTVIGSPRDFATLRRELMAAQKNQVTDDAS